MDPTRIIPPETPIGTIISFVVAAAIVIVFLFSIALIIVSVIQFALNFRKNKVRANSAKKRLLIGIFGLICTTIMFIVINLIISAPTGRLGPLRITSLEKIK